MSPISPTAKVRAAVARLTLSPKAAGQGGRPRADIRRGGTMGRHRASRRTGSACSNPTLGTDFEPRQ